MSQQATQTRSPAAVTAADLAYGAPTALLESDARAVDSRKVPAEPVRQTTPATRTRRKTTPAAKPKSAPRARSKTTRAAKPAPVQEAPEARLLLGRRASRKKWEAVRREGIGGSDVAALFGLAGKWSSPRHVFEEKHGRPTFRETEPAEIGREIESFVARMFTKRSGLKTRMPLGMIANVERPWMRANVDRYVLDAEGNIEPHPPAVVDNCPICTARAKGETYTDGHGRIIDPPTGRPDRVYVTTDREYARFYASKSWLGDLYVVEPAGGLQESTEDPFPTWTCEAARVASVYSRTVRLTPGQRRTLSNRWARADMASALRALERGR